MKPAFLQSVRCAIRVPMVLAMVLLPCVAPSVVADEVVTDCSNDTEFRNDWNAIQSNPDAGDVLTFNCGTTAIVLTGGYLTNVRHTIVDGAGVITLSGGNATRIFSIAAGGDLTLKNLTLTLGNAPGAGSAGDGGCIWSDGALTLVNTIVDGCHANNDGGGIYSSTNGQIIIDGSSIRNNTAQRDCGGICEYGVSLYVVGSVIDRNQAVTRYAGGIGGANSIQIVGSLVR